MVSGLGGHPEEADLEQGQRVRERRHWGVETTQRAPGRVPASHGPCPKV